MDEQQEKQVWEPSEIDIKMDEALGHTVKIIMESGKEIVGYACYYEDATSADEDFPIIYISNEDGDGAEGYGGDAILDIEIID